MFGRALAGRYVIRRELGSGASARVYQAEDQRTGGVVALKVLNETAAKSLEAVSRLLREGSLGALVNHPNVCAVTDVGTLEDGAPFLVMEHLSGETLAARLAREKTLPLDVALGFTEQILLGLHAGHALGIIHRDLKPANIFLVDLGLGRWCLKVLDFGTAYFKGRTVREESPASLTRTGLVVGTPEYMSPEQVRGLRDFDARTDVYACGVVLYEMLAGRRPFHGMPTEQLAQAVAFQQAPPLATLAPQVPPAIARAVDGALAVSPSRRHVDAAAFLAALGHSSVPEALPTVSLTVRGPVDDWEVPTKEGAPPTDWDLVTNESGPPSILGRVAGDVENDEPTRTRPRR